MPRNISYTFETDGKQPWNYILEFDDNNNLVAHTNTDIKEWTKLEYHQCAHCPLNISEHQQCPVARNLNDVVEDFKNVLSFTKYKVTVQTAERTYSKECSTQDGLKSIFGLIMACSGCPYLDWLNPLARFHLPFANLEETLFRTLSLQLLNDFLDNQLTDANIIAQKISARYKNVETINRAFAKRIQYYCQKDADKNAISSLDVYVQMFDIFQEANFDVLRDYFKK
jgi:hypothetical protein